MSRSRRTLLLLALSLALFTPAALADQAGQANQAHQEDHGYCRDIWGDNDDLVYRCRLRQNAAHTYIAAWAAKNNLSRDNIHDRYDAGDTAAIIAKECYLKSPDYVAIKICIQRRSKAAQQIQKIP